MATKRVRGVGTRKWIRALMVAAGGAVLIAAAALVEWLGWEIVWRDEGARQLDFAWSVAFAVGVGNNVLGALGVGFACAGIAAALLLVVPRWRGSARRGAFTAGFAGAVAFLATLGMLALTAL